MHRDTPSRARRQPDPIPWRRGCHPPGLTVNIMLRHYVDHRNPLRKEIVMTMLMGFARMREFAGVFKRARSKPRQASMPMDAYRHGDSFVINLDLPGVDPGSIDLTV